MAKVDLGEKRVCPECSSKFYDLTRRPAVCPKCAFSYNPDEVAAPAPTPVEEIIPENEATDAEKEEQEEIDEEEAETRELELDGDDAAIIGGASDGDDDGVQPDFNTFDPDEDEDEDAALVDDEDDALPPTGADDDDDAEEVEI